MKHKLNDNEYEQLKNFASLHRMKLYGWQAVLGGIRLNNSKRSGVWGKSIAELQQKIANS